ncbi:hypothetical protein [Streptomyces lasiicapitis]|uniref:hypothetical protein n=1 Tax=Streptomyces lasiicapitis TaxID=1923961 RepID=UPI003648A4AB
MIHLILAAALIALSTAAILHAVDGGTRSRPLLIVRAAALTFGSACLLLACLVNAVNP